MRLNRKILSVILSFILLQSCIEPFIPETTTYDNIIFIEALVTNESGFMPEVSISSTVPLKNFEEEDMPKRSDAIVDAEIFLQCDNGKEYKFDQPESSAPASKYRLSDPNFSAEPGKSYKIIIYLDGEVFESDFEILKESPAIDSIGYDVKTLKLTEDGINEEGYQFLVSNHSNESEPSYYRWLLDATYSFTAPHVSEFMYTNTSNVLIPYITDGGRICWKNKNISGTYISTTEGLSENSIIEAPLNFESQYGDELTNLYSLHVKQLAISQESYYFWDEINNMVYESGDLFERQPYRIKGNIKCTSNPDLSVIGIFEVAGVSEFREFFNRPVEFTVWGYNCDLIKVDVNNPFRNFGDKVYVIYDEETNAMYAAYSGCFECRGRGGSTIKPAFWEDN